MAGERQHTDCAVVVVCDGHIGKATAVEITHSGIVGYRREKVPLTFPQKTLILSAFQFAVTTSLLPLPFKSAVAISSGVVPLLGAPATKASAALAIALPKVAVIAFASAVIDASVAVKTPKRPAETAIFASSVCRFAYNQGLRLQ